MNRELGVMRAESPGEASLFTAGGEREARSVLRRILLLACAAAVILIGQAGRDLLPPDDLREAEIAREMYSRSDYIIPHLAGRPFTEKPPGFSAAVAAAFALTGGPSIAAARFAAAAFALAGLGAVFLLGRRLLGAEGGALAAAVLAVSMRFCRTAHEVLLDNALCAAWAFALFFAWIALDLDDIERKRRAYAKTAFSLGIAFLFKGFVGPALFGAGLVAYLLATRRIRELKHLFRPLPVTAFLLPSLLWFIPYLIRGGPALAAEFLILNHLERFTAAYASNARPFHFYLLDIWQGFFPCSILLPFAAAAAWRDRRRREGMPGFFFLAMFLGPLALLSLSRAKDSVYLLPAYPAMAILVAWWCTPFLEGRGGRRTAAPLAAFGVLAALCALTAAGATAYLGGTPLNVCCAAAALTGGVWSTFRSIKKCRFHEAVPGITLLVTIGWILWFTGPIAALETGKRNIRSSVEPLLSAAGKRKILLFNPNDGIRGAAGFYRNRTAEEIDRPLLLIERMKDDPNTVLLLLSPASRPLPEILENAARAGGIVLVKESEALYSERKVLVLCRASPRRT